MSLGVRGCLSQRKHCAYEESMTQNPCAGPELHSPECIPKTRRASSSAFRRSVSVVSSQGEAVRQVQARICCHRFLGDQLDLPLPMGPEPPNSAFLVLRAGWPIDLKTLRWCLLPPLSPADIVQCSLKARCWVGK